MPNLTMTSFGSNGRLGNQCFQFCGLYGLSRKYNMNLQLPEWPYAKYFEGEFPASTDCGGEEIKEPTFKYVENWNFNGDTDIWGFLQSEKYWLHCEDEVKARLTFKSDFREQVLNNFKEVFQKETIGISIRRGDYVGNKNYAQLPITYFILALRENFPNWKNCNIILFSDDIPYCRVHFDCLPNVTFSENNSDIEDLCLLSECDNIILSNSTFSWWGAYLGKKKKVVRPAYLFDGRLKQKNDESDFWVPEWVIFDHIAPNTDFKKIDLRDTCFTIPVSYDHPDRKENLDLCIKILRRNFHTNIIVYEQGTTPKFEYLRDSTDYYNSVDLYKFDTYEGKFHRTKMLNDMALASSCEYIFNWDADVLIPPFQILEAVEQLRKGADMVYPYKWAFVRIPRKIWFQKIWNYDDIGVIGDTKFNGMNSGDAISVGGAVGFRKTSFMEGGMENENFISYGPEDVERKLRFEKLGYKIERTVGNAMYHINHWVGPNSSFSNPDYQKNADELKKVENMTKEELQEYVKTWDWLPK